jgi:hypothetical protein
MGALLDSAYLTEYGLDSTVQSSLNLVYLLGFTEGGAEEGARAAGENPERLRIRYIP